MASQPQLNTAVRPQTLVSGIRSTGELHLGNYYGALRGLLSLQDRYDSFFFIADLHALTTHPDPDNRIRQTIEVAKDYIAAGVDPRRSAFYDQSSIAAELAELHLYLSMVMPLGELIRCPTFKEKAKKHPDNVNYGLVGYPVLMTADILIHKSELVQVGEDQLVHLEIARTITRRFNQLYGEVFPEPHPLVEHAVRIPALSGEGKMSKSDSADAYVSLKDDPERIGTKVKKAYSDPTRIRRELPGTPTREGCNVYHLHSYFSHDTMKSAIREQCLSAKIGCVQCKALLTESLVSVVEPIRERRERFSDADIVELLHIGSEKARLSAQAVISEVRRAMGFTMV
ncbi:tryptophan--tRNA ligase [Paenibacillus sp. HJGM_3]|uniref:tryptophan--tRNA ligase n=1 Tax=Paenibacillus sp. HJGM_3 TaxID=3379816 RepID=UPI00385FAAA7